MTEQLTTHEEELIRLRRIEGQIRGVQKMIEEKGIKNYLLIQGDCVDILTQLSSIVGAIKGVEENILERHLKGCVQHSFIKGKNEDKAKKIDEVIKVLKKFRKY